MSYLEDEFKQRFTNRQEKTDPAEADALWNDIAGELADDQAGGSPANGAPKPSFFRAWRWLLPLILLSILLLGYFTVEHRLSRAADATEVTQAAPEPANDSVDDAAPDFSRLADQVTEIDQPPVTKVGRDEAIPNSDTSIATLKPPYFTSHETRNANEKNEGLEKALTKNAQKARTINADSATVTTQGDTSFFDFNSEELATIAEGKLAKIKSGEWPTYSVSELPSKAQATLRLPLARIKPPATNAANEAQKFRKTARAEWSTSFYGGPRQLSFDFREAADPEYQSLREQTETGLTGAAFGAELSYRRKNWSLGLGLEYGRDWARFSYQQAVDSLFDLTNVPLGVIVNQDGNVIDQLFGDTTLLATGFRNVRHHNRIDTYGLPLTIGYGQELGRFRVGLTAGITPFISRQRPGRGLSPQSSLIEYAANDEPRYFSRSGVQLRFALRLGYRLGDRWALELRPRFIFAGHELDGLRLRSRQYGLIIGLRRYW